MSLLSNPSDGPYKAGVATGRGRGYHDGHGVDDDGGGRGRGHGKQLEASGDVTTNAWICPSARGDSGPKQWRYFKSLCFPFTKLDPSRSPFLYPSSIRGGLDASDLGRGGWRGYSLWNGRERERTSSNCGPRVQSWVCRRVVVSHVWPSDARRGHRSNGPVFVAFDRPRCTKHDGSVEQTSSTEDSLTSMSGPRVQ